MQDSKRSAYRIVVWGPGGLGKICIWEALQRDDLELVGVYTYSKDKQGIDAGTFVGLEPCRVRMSGDAAEVLAIDCDCIVYTARDHGNYHNDDEIVSILAAGRNIVTALPYQSVQLTRDAAFIARLRDACNRGRAVFHATGVDPDVLGDRLILGLTGLCNDISSIRLQEIWDSSYTPADTLKMCGFGETQEEAARMTGAATIAENFLQQVGTGLADALGIPLARTEMTHEYHLTPVDVDCATLPIKAGRVARVVHLWSGYTGGAQPFFRVELNWILGKSMVPAGVAQDQYWIVTIEGRPSIRMTVDIKASIESGARFIPIGDERTEPGYHATVAACLQAIPRICASPPGILEAVRPAVHWRRSLTEPALST